MVMEGKVGHVGKTEIPTYAADRVDTMRYGCRPRITVFDRAIVIFNSLLLLSLSLALSSKLPIGILLE